MYVLAAGSRASFRVLLRSTDAAAASKSSIVSSSIFSFVSANENANKAMNMMNWKEKYNVKHGFLLNLILGVSFELFALRIMGGTS